jgi:hypothetical protein
MNPNPITVKEAPKMSTSAWMKAFYETTYELTLAEQEQGKLLTPFAIRFNRVQIDRLKAEQDVLLMKIQEGGVTENG